MAYEAKTQNDLAKWWVIGTGSVVNRLSEIMDDFPLGPAIYYTTGWTASAPEYYRTQATANDSAQEKIGAGAWSALVLGAGVGLLNAGEYFYDVGTTRLYVRLTGDVAPNATNQVRAHYVWNGAGAGPAWMTEVVEDVTYRIHVNIEIGDGSTATTLISTDESVYFDSGCIFLIKSNAGLTLGELSGSNGIKGALWYLTNVSSTTVLLDGNSSSYFKMYDSILHAGGTSGVVFGGSGGSTGVVDIKQSTLRRRYDSGGTSSTYFRFRVYLTSLGIVNTYINNARVLQLDKAPSPFENVILHKMYDVITTNVSGVIADSIDATDWTNDLMVIAGVGTTFTLLDPKMAFLSTDVQIDNATSAGQLYRRVNIHVSDKDGANLSGVTVNLYGSVTTSYDTAAWTEGSVTTAADGTITEQTIIAKKWVGTSETETDYNVFKLVCSKAGYETLILENITIDAPIDWHLELQDEPTDADVAQAVWTYANRTLTG